MKKNLLDYVKKYQVIPHKLCDHVVNDLADAEWIQHTFYDPKTDEIINRSGNKELYITGKQPSAIRDLTHYINSAIYKYVEETSPIAWNGPNEMSNTRFNRYTKDQVMAIHCDHIHSIFDGTRRGIPVITILSVLSDEYTGGEFIMFEDTLIKLNKGDVLIFPSVFLYPHKVQPITSGVRYTCVNWAW